MATLESYFSPHRTRSYSKAVREGFAKAKSPRRVMSPFIGPKAPSMRSKRQRYGKDQGKFKIVTTNVYPFRLHTFSVNQASDATSGAFPIANVPAYYPEPLTAVGTSSVWSDWNCSDPQTFRQMNPRTTLIAVDADRPVVTNTLLNMGARYMISEEVATTANPYYVTYLGFKLDALGFNCCDPLQFSTLCTQFSQVKQGPYAMTFNFTEPPLGKFEPYRTYVFSGAEPLLTSIGAAHSEHHSMGQWEYIIIPPRSKASVMLPSIMGSKNWEKLIDMGFKIRKCGTSHTIYCPMKGPDWKQIDYVRNLPYGVVAPSDSIIDNGSAVNYANGRVVKHTWVDTEKACQTCRGNPVPNTAPIGNWPAAFGTNAVGGNFGCVPQGSAIVFCFKQYAPVNPMAGIIQTARRQTIAIEIRVDSFTKFRGPNLEQLDLDQQNGLPYQQ